MSKEEKMFWSWVEQCELMAEIQSEEGKDNV